MIINNNNNSGYLSTIKIFNAVELNGIALSSGVQWPKELHSVNLSKDC